MTSIHAALVRLNVAPQKIGFWEVQLENAIKRAEFLSDFDAEQVSKKTQTTKSELSNFERAIRAGTRTLLLQKRFANLFKPTTEIINSQLSIRSNDRVNLEDLDLDKDDQRQARKRLLTGLVRCGCCGGGMTIIGRERYACSARREQGTCTNATSIKAQELEQRVFDGLQSILLGREETMTAFAEAFHAEVKRRQTHTASQKTVVQKELLKVETGIKRCVDLLLHSDTPMDSIRNTLEELEAQKRALTRELSLQTEEDKIVLHPNIGELYARKIGDLKSILQNDATKHQATEIIQSLIEKIVVSPTGQRGKSDVVLHGALASILA